MPAQKDLSGTLVVGALVLAGLVLGKPFLLPLAMAGVLAFALAPIVRWLTMRRVPRAPAVIAVVGVLTGLVVVLASSFLAQVVSLLADLDRYLSNIAAKARALADAGHGGGLIARAIANLERLGEIIERSLPGPGASSGPVVLQSSEGQSALSLERVELLASPLLFAALMLLLLVFLLLQYHDLRDRVVRFAGTHNISATTAAMTDAGTRLSRLFLRQAALNTAYGVAVGIVLWLLGIPSPFLWGGASIALRFIPFLGPVISAAPPVLLAAAVAPGWGLLLATLAFLVVGEIVMGNIVEPIVLGPSAGLSPFAMIASAAFWTLVWGPVGLLLAAPLTMAIAVVGRYVPGLELAAVLLGDEPALEAEEELYQRLLAADAMAAYAGIETALETASLVSVCDSVVLPGLRLAGEDYAQGRLTRERAEALQRTAEEVIALLADGGEIGAGQGEAATKRLHEALFVAGRGPIDQIAAQFMAAAAAAELPSYRCETARVTGMTALAASGEGPHPELVVLCTVGGVEGAHLGILVRRAKRVFPEAMVAHVVHAGRAESPATPSTQYADAGYPTLADLLSSIVYAPATVTAAAEGNRAAHCSVSAAGEAASLAGETGARTMDWDRVQGNWKQFKGKAKEAWGQLTDDELDSMEGRRDQLEGALQNRYGYAKDKARDEVDRWLGRF